MAGTKGDRSPGTLRSHFKNCEAILDRIFESRHRDFQNDFEPALEKTILHFDIPKKLLGDVIDGAVLHAFFKRPQSDDEFSTLSYHRSGVWAAVLSYVFGADQKAKVFALDFASGLWLAKRAIEVERDGRMGRVYFPQSWPDVAQGDHDAVSSLGARATTQARETLTRLRTEVSSLPSWRLRLTVKLVIGFALRSLDPPRAVP